MQVTCCIAHGIASLDIGGKRMKGPKRLTIEKTERGYTVAVDSPDGSGKQEWIFSDSGADAGQGIDELIEACGADEDGMDAWDDLQNAIYNFMEALHEGES